MKKCNNFLRESMKKIGLKILSIMLLMSVFLTYITMIVSAQTNEIDDVTLDSARNELVDSDNYTIEQVADELFGDISVRFAKDY